MTENITFHSLLEAKSYKLKAGFSLVEVVIGTAILFIALTGLSTVYNRFVGAGLATLRTIQGTYLLEEGVEAVTTIRDFGWSGNIANLTTGAAYYLAWNGTRWTATTTVSKIDDAFTRTFTLQSVNRDANDTIVPSGTNDSGTRKLIISVSWPNGATTTTKTVSTYITNLFND